MPNMNIALFYHSLVSDWNHGNAHFLRGIAWELKRRGHKLRIFEPAGGWSLTNLLREHGEAPLEAFAANYPGLRSTFYDPATLDLEEALDLIDLVIVHEWNDPAWVRRIGAHRRTRGGYRLLFHDTHHRSVTEPEKMAAYDLAGYDGVLVFGKAIAEIYDSRNWARRVWVWHEAADTRVFMPLPEVQKEGDLVWIGNWGDDERSAELQEFLLEPVKALGLKAQVYGVRYPAEAIGALSEAGIEYRGWLPNFQAPGTLARFRLTVHTPRRPYVKVLPGVPTIRPFEALACGIPLVCAPWEDSEGLFSPGKDYLLARDGAEMKRQLRRVLADPKLAGALSVHGRETILQRHSCAHRVDQLLDIYRRIDAPVTSGKTTHRPREKQL
jgi:spore maturation protein CgeB